MAAAACEAVAAPVPAKPMVQAPGTTYISEQINHAVQGKIDGRIDNKSSRSISRVTKDSYVFETQNKKGEVIHLNVIQK